MLDRYLVRLQAGERFLIIVGETWYTLSLAKYEDLTRLVSNISEVDGEPFESDQQLLSNVVNSSVTVERPGLRLGRDYEFTNGEFFAYTHDYEDSDLSKELANLGCWT